MQNPDPNPGPGSTADRPTDLLIVGAGPVGLALALALKESGLDITLADTRRHDAIAADPRVLALSHGTRLTLERLGAWHGLPATAIETIHISQRNGFGRTLLRAADHGIPALGYVASAGALAAALRRAADAAGIRVLDQTQVTLPSRSGSNTDAIGFELCHPGGERTTHAARLAACAEGAMQPGDPDIVEHDYGQHALISHARIDPAPGHHHTAFERFTTDGPLALLPHGTGYAVVHVAPPARADELLALNDSAYLARIQAIIGPRAHLSAVTERLRYPLLLRYRRQPVGARTVWLGNAAQTLHPVAGQGFNLALRDVWALAETLLARHDLHNTGDIGAPALLAAYVRARGLDRFGTIRFTDLLARLFATDTPLLHHTRGAGLLALDLFPPLRHFVARRMLFGARAWP